MRDVSGVEEASEPDRDVALASSGPSGGQPPRANASAERSAESLDDGKWSLAVRVAVITGSAAALWGVIWLGYRAL